MTNDSMPTRVGFIGPRRDGCRHGGQYPEGYPLTLLGHSRREPVARLLSLEASEADSAADLARRSDVIFVWA